MPAHKSLLRVDWNSPSALRPFSALLWPSSLFSPRLLFLPSLFQTENTNSFPWSFGAAVILSPQRADETLLWSWEEDQRASTGGSGTFSVPHKNKKAAPPSAPGLWWKGDYSEITLFNESARRRSGLWRPVTVRVRRTRRSGSAVRAADVRGSAARRGGPCQRVSLSRLLMWP